MNAKQMFVMVSVVMLIGSCADKQTQMVPKVSSTDSQVIKAEKIYKVGVGDILEILTWKEPDFSREVQVRIDGKISFPLLNDIQAAGRTTLDIRDEIQTKLQDYVNHPVVSVSIKLAESQKIYILGEVLKPGEYPLSKHLTVLQALALSGGFTEWASKSDIKVLRSEAGQTNTIQVDYDEIEDGNSLEQNISLEANDIIVVP